MMGLRFEGVLPNGEWIVATDWEFREEREVYRIKTQPIPEEFTNEETEMTVEEIERALGYRVKVVGGSRCQ